MSFKIGDTVKYRKINPLNKNGGKYLTNYISVPCYYLKGNDVGVQLYLIKEKEIDDCFPYPTLLREESVLLTEKIIEYFKLFQ